jgi:hypothetical protein
VTGARCRTLDAVNAVGDPGDPQADVAEESQPAATADGPRGPLSREGSYAAAVYGSILTTGVVAGLRDSASAETIALTLLATNVVFWLAHVWSELLGERIETGTVGNLARLRRLAAEEWPMVEAGMLPFVALVAAWSDVCSDEVGVDLALGLAIAQLAGWGLLGARRMRLGWAKSIVIGLLDGVLGLGIIGLEALLH